MDTCGGWVLEMSGPTIGYVRVSAADQNADRQIEILGKCDQLSHDRMSGKPRAKRTGLAELITYVCAGDTVRMASMDRLGGDTRDLYNVVAELTEKDAPVQFVQENIPIDQHGSSPLDSLMLGILAAFAEFERRRIKERQAEGIAIAKAKGKYVQPLSYPLAAINMRPSKISDLTRTASGSST